jgi:tetrahydromethanopterin S-methyltransferase subunit C
MEDLDMKNTLLTIMISIMSLIITNLTEINEVISFIIGIATLFIVLGKCWDYMKKKFDEYYQKKD